MWNHLLQCAINFILNPQKMTVALISLSITFILFYSIKQKKLPTNIKTVAIYFHIATLIFPIAFFLYTMSCEVGLFICNSTLVETIFLSIPLTAILSIIISYFIIPKIYSHQSKNMEIKNGVVFDQILKISKIHEIKTPKIYTIDSEKPQAFSTTGKNPAIFFSLNFLEALTLKEVEAVFLHEIAHIQRGSSNFKISSILLKLSPFLFFNTLENEFAFEEFKADEFAIKTQRTNKHLNSAKQKQMQLKKNNFFKNQYNDHLNTNL